MGLILAYVYYSLYTALWTILYGFANIRLVTEHSYREIPRLLSNLHITCSMVLHISYLILHTMITSRHSMWYLFIVGSTSGYGLYYILYMYYNKYRTWMRYKGIILLYSMKLMVGGYVLFYLILHNKGGPHIEKIISSTWVLINIIHVYDIHATTRIVDIINVLLQYVIHPVGLTYIAVGIWKEYGICIALFPILALTIFQYDRYFK